MRPLDQIGLVRKLKVVHKQVGGYLIPYSLGHLLSCPGQLKNEARSKKQKDKMIEMNYKKRMTIQRIKHNTKHCVL